VKIVAGIPARMGSSRFPGKPLCSIAGKTMLEHVYKRCALSASLTGLFVAACDPEVRAAAEKFGGKVIMTDPDIPRPGLRVAAAAETLGLADDDIVVVVQGDEPLVRPEMIDLAVEPLLKEKDVLVSNLAAEPTDEEWADPNEIKVVADLKGNALYMSRSPIPSKFHQEKPPRRMKQVCIMPFRWHFMRTFNALAPTPMEEAESIEMLRAIQHGYKVRMVPSPFKTKSVDNEADRAAAEALMKGDPLFAKYGGRP
jgi:3-deoxy-manno-octulosonate cytidylyltransferase (CMP-KDO synthetase)